MATKINISKKLEKRLRESARTSGAPVQQPVLVELVALLNVAQAAKGLTGLAAQTFIDAVQENQKLTLPPAGPLANRTYARLVKTLRDFAVTEDQARALGVWLSGQTKWLGPTVTIDRIITNLSDWLTRAVSQQPKWEKPEW